MGLAGGEQNGNVESVSEIRLVSNDNKYKRVDDKNHDSKKFVFVCAIFASLNSVLLGYGCHSFFLIQSAFAKYVCL